MRIIGLEVFQRIQKHQNASKLTPKQPHDNVRNYSHSMAAGACATILACFCFPKLLKVEGDDVGGEGGDA